MIRKVVFILACAGLLQAGKYVTYQQAEIITTPRSSASPTPLLFAFVITLSGFDTEITISNTSQDTLAGTPQNGSCTFSFYGAGAPAPQTSNVIPAGGQLIFRLSQGGGGIAPAPAFQGYIAASCAFPSARGVARILGPGVFAVSQDAQVLTLPRSTTKPQNLLFQFASNLSGFDTGIILANTSLDPFGTTANSGSCTLSFYGTNAPAAFTTPSIAAGSLYTNLISQLAPNFQGYVIGSCNFTGLAGFAFVGDLGLRNTAFAESPESITLPRSTAATSLVFTSESNQSGLDSGISIANTTTDPFGTVSASGPCTLNFFGSNAPAPVTTPAIASGTVYLNLMSTLAPNFQGYVVATCSFPQARGWSFTTNFAATADGDAQIPEVLTSPVVRSNIPAPLLFSTASNWTGNDTNIIISNTTRDPYATSQVSGTCTISYFGVTGTGGAAPSAQTSASIAPGGQLSFTLSQGNPAQGIAATPGFHGYIIASCTFPLARGLAIITGIPQSQFVSVTPCRIADTREPNGPFGGPAIPTGTSRSFAFPFSSCGISPTATAYSINVTVVPHGLLGYVTVYPTGQPVPLASTLNSIDGRVKASAAIVPAGSNGSVSVFASDTTDVVLDINGYFVPTPTSETLTFYPLTPCRIADTRNANAPLGGPFMPTNSTRTFPVLSSSCGVSPTAQAYSLNFTTVPHHSLGYITTWPTGTAKPVVSTLNAITGQVTANAAIVPVGTAGNIDVYATDDTDLVIDINGYFAPSGGGGLSFYSLTPCRVVDTRVSIGSPFVGTLGVNVSGSACAPPVGAQGYVFGATVVPSGLLGYLTLWPQGLAQPVVSTLNSLDGAVTSNMAIVPTTNGQIDSFATHNTYLILDIAGYFAP